MLRTYLKFVFNLSMEKWVHLPHTGFAMYSSLVADNEIDCRHETGEGSCPTSICLKDCREFAARWRSSRNRKAAERTRRSVAARTELSAPRRPRTNRDLCFISERLLFLPDSPRCDCRRMSQRHHDLVKRVKADFQAAEISEKLKALLVIAAKVQKGGKHVTAADVEAARTQGATDLEIHDTVLIAAAFCMYNRYVDGLDTWQPRDEALYRERGKKTAREGYVSMSREYLAGRGTEP